MPESFLLTRLGSVNEGVGVCPCKVSFAFCATVEYGAASSAMWVERASSAMWVERGKQT